MIEKNFLVSGEAAQKLIRNSNFKRKIFFTPVLVTTGIFLLVAVAFFLGTRSTKWLNSRNEAELLNDPSITQTSSLVPSPPEEDWFIEGITKEIDGVKYSFALEDQADGGPKSARFMAYENNEPKQIGQFPDSFNFEVSQLVGDSTTDFWFFDPGVQQDKTLFLIESIFDRGLSRFEGVIKVPLDFHRGGGQPQIVYIAPSDSYHFSKILDYFPESDTLLLDTGAGDGCGVVGVIWKLDATGKRRDIKEYGGGCTLSEDKVSYKGYFDRKLYFATVKYDETLPPPDKYADDSYFSLDPFNLQKIPLHSLPENLQ